MDLSKAFDTVDHQILLNKLSNYGFRGPVLELIQSYLTGRKQFVSCNNTISDTLPVTIGVPQGSVLGPLMFLIYVNDMRNALINNDASIVLYADDTTLYSQTNNIYDLCNCLENNLKSLKLWLDTNYLSLNLEKTHFTIFTNKHIPDDIVVKIDDQIFNFKSSTTFLGVIIDEKLTFREQILKIKGKISKSIGIFHKLSFLPCETLKILYYCLIYPYLLYCILVWGSASKSTINLLFMKQKRLVRIINHSYYTDSSSPIFKNLNLLKLEDIFNLYCIDFIDSVLKNKKCEYFFNKIMLHQVNHNYDTRGENLRLPSVSLGWCKQDVVYRGLKLWNDLPNYIKSIESKYLLKKTLKEKFINAY